MKKGKFYIALRDGDKIFKKLVTGYILTIEGIDIGVCKPRIKNFCLTFWRSVDIDSGVAVVYARTREECVEKTKEIFEKFLKAKAKSKFTHEWLESLDTREEKTNDIKTDC